MQTCPTCGSDSADGANFCVQCGHKLNRGLPWYVAILASLGAGFAAFFLGVLDDDGSSTQPDIRLQVEISIVLAVGVFAATLWFTWLRFSVKRRRVGRRRERL